MKKKVNFKYGEGVAQDIEAVAKYGVNNLTLIVEMLTDVIRFGLHNGTKQLSEQEKKDIEELGFFLMEAFAELIPHNWDAGVTEDNKAAAEKAIERMRGWVDFASREHTDRYIELLSTLADNTAVFKQYAGGYSHDIEQKTYVYKQVETITLLLYNISYYYRELRTAEAPTHQKKAQEIAKGVAKQKVRISMLSEDAGVFRNYTIDPKNCTEEILSGIAEEDGAEWDIKIKGIAAIHNI